MITHPTAEELVRAVAEWIDQIRPQLDPRNQFMARVAANALGTVGRELTEGPAAEAEALCLLRDLLGHDGDFETLNTELCDRIRTGGLTVDTPGLLDALRTMAAAQLAIDQPTYRSELK